MNTVQRIVIAGAAAWLAAAGSTADAQTQDFVSGMSVNAIVRDAPFSGEGITTVTQMLADGTRIDRTTTSKLYRRQRRTRAARADDHGARGAGPFA